MSIYVVGFVSDGDVGGFDWFTTRAAGVNRRRQLVESGTYDIVGPFLVNVPPEIIEPDAITAWLDNLPDLWTPKYGEGR